MPLAFVLLHSPLVGPDTWHPVAATLGALGHAAVVPVLPESLAPERPYWAQHAESVAGQAAELTRPVLVAHSGAGALLPAVCQALGRLVAGCLFVDAGLPAPGQSRLESFGAGAAEFRARLEAGGRFPDWTDDDLRPLVPDAARRARLLAGLRPQTLAYWDERLPPAPGWPAAPGGYLLFSPVYAEAAAQARRLGWPVREMPGGHFHMLVEPEAVAQALLDLIA